MTDSSRFPRALSSESKVNARWFQCAACNASSSVSRVSVPASKSWQFMVDGKEMYRGVECVSVRTQKRKKRVFVYASKRHQHKSFITQFMTHTQKRPCSRNISQRIACFIIMSCAQYHDIGMLHAPPEQCVQECTRQVLSIRRAAAA